MALQMTLVKSALVFGIWKHTLKYSFEMPLVIQKREQLLFHLIHTSLSYRNRN